MNEAEKGFEVGYFEVRDKDRHLPEYWLKQWLWYYRNQGAFRRDHEAAPQLFCWQRLLIIVFIIVALTLMVLLLLWNYQCIIIEKMCQGQESSMFPGFGDERQSHITQKPTWMAKEDAHLPTLSVP